MKKRSYKAVTSDGKVKISINFDPVLLAKLDEDSESKGLRRSAWFTVAAMSYLQRDEKERIVKEDERMKIKE